MERAGASAILANFNARLRDELLNGEIIHS